MTSGNPLNPAITHLRCVHCGREYPPQFRYQCECGGNLDVEYDFAAVETRLNPTTLAGNPDHTLWRYAPLLPVATPPAELTLPVGGTPLLPAPGLAKELGLKELWFKDDTRQPTASLKDRASAMAVAYALAGEIDTIAAASTGNAAASLAGLCARAGLKALIFAPATAPAAKLTQIRSYGAVLIPVDANYDRAFDLCQELSATQGWFNRNTGINPLLSEGKKTVALEIAEQLRWQVPDLVFVPVGDGCILGGVHKGFQDLHRLGWIENLPRLVAVQAEGSAAIVTAFQEQRPLTPVKSQTVADSIAVDFPRDGEKALRALQQTDGLGLTVSDSEILTAQQLLARRTGLFVEPAAAAAFAGLLQLSRQGKTTNLRAVVLATGSGLKDIPAAQRQLPPLKPVPPDQGKILAYLEQTGEISLP